MCKRQGLAVAWLVLATISLAHAFSTFIPNDKELIYNYEAFIGTGTDLPVPYTSQLRLLGNLHIARDGENAITAKLSDLRCQLYNGKRPTGLTKSEDINNSLPEEITDIETLFKIKYNHNGTVTGIVTSNRENDYTRNIKKSIASILQVNLRSLEKHSNSFIQEEPSLYGSQQAYYTALRLTQNSLEIQKFIEMSSSNRWYGRHLTNSPSSCCGKGFANPISQTSHRRYIIDTIAGKPTVRHLTGSGQILYTSFNGKSDDFYIIANQTMNLLKAKTDKGLRKVEDEYLEEDISYKFFNDDMEESEIVPDVTHKRIIVNIKKLIPEILNMMRDINLYFDEDHITAEPPNFEKGQLIERCRTALVQCSLADLKKIENNLPDTNIRRIFRQMLPLLGTKASVLYIKDLVIHKRDNKLTDNEVITMLTEMPLNIMVPTRQLLEEMKGLLKTSMTWNMKKAVILSFGTLVHRSYTYEDRKMQLDHSTEGCSANLKVKENEDPKLRYYQPYIDEFINQVRQAKTFEERLAWLAGLYNIKLVSTIEPIMDLFKEPWCDHDHKIPVIFSVYSVIKEHPNLISKHYLPLLVDRNQHPEIRLVSYFLIMTSQPTLDQISNIFWYMQDELDEELYNLHYTFVKEMSESVSPCYIRIKKICRQFLLNMRKSPSGISSFNVKEYIDPIYNYGMSYLEVILYARNSLIYQRSSMSHISNMVSIPETTFIKIHGSNKVFQNLQLNTDRREKSLLMNSLSEIYKNFREDKDAKIDIVKEAKQNVIHSEQISAEGLPDVFGKLNNTETLKAQQSSVYISYEMYKKMFLPTDLGFLAFWSYIVPTATKTSLDFSISSRSNVIDIHIDNRYQNWVHSKHGLQFYNPIHDIYQRVLKFHSHDTSLPLSMDLNVDIPNSSGKFFWRRHEDVKKDVAGIKTHVTTVISGRNSLNQEASKNLLDDGTEMVSAGPEYRRNYTWIDQDVLMTGHHWTHMGFDMERYVSNGTWTNTWFSRTLPSTKHFKMLYEYISLTGLNWYHYNILQPETGTHGILLRVEPLKNRKISCVELNVKWNYDISPSQFVFTPNLKLFYRFTYTIKEDDQKGKTWDLGMVWKMDHALEDLKWNFTRIVPGQDNYKVCLKWNRVFNPDRMLGKLRITAGQSKRTEDTCPTEDTIDVTMTGEESNEQKDMNHVYGNCKNPQPHFRKPWKPLQCISDHFTLRKYNFTTKTSDNLSSFLKNYILTTWDTIRSYYIKHYNVVDEHKVYVGENSLSIGVTYPMEGDQMDVYIYTPHRFHSLTGVPTKPFETTPENVEFSALTLTWHALKLIDHCQVRQGTRRWLNINGQKEVHEVPNEWTLYVGDKDVTAKHAVYLKRVAEDELALKLMYKDNVIEIDPKNVPLSNNELPNQESFSQWLRYRTLDDGISKSSAFVMPRAGIYIEYEKNSIKILIPRLDFDWKGKCVRQRH